MSFHPTLRLDHLSLTNFRCFRECSIELHSKLTVLIAENGGGKTAILDAIGIALRLFVDSLAGTRGVHGFDRTDVRMVQGDDHVMRPDLPTDFVADGYVVGRSMRWRRALKNYSLRARTTTVEAKDFRQAATDLRENVLATVTNTNEDPQVLPLVGFYGTGRLWREHRLTEVKREFDTDVNSRMSGYTDCLSSSSSFKGVVAWYENKMNETRDPRFSTELAQNLALLSAVQEATRVVLEPTGWQNLAWNFDSKSLMVEHSDYGQLPLSALSDGIRNMIALVVDIAHRCARLNPHLSEGAARLTPGILLIDEIDMHLHPLWQQTVIELMTTAFPFLQMVFTTHSPHVLSTVDMASIRIIRLNDGFGVLETPKFQTRGVESADVLATIMSVDPIPPVIEARWVRDFYALIQQNQFETPDAEALRAKLENHFGRQHPVLLESDRLIRLERFKRSLPSSPTSRRE